MSSHCPKGTRLKGRTTLWFLTALFSLATSGIATQADPAQGPPEDTPRKIIADDFTQSRQRRRLQHPILGELHSLWSMDQS